MTESCSLNLPKLENYNQTQKIIAGAATIVLIASAIIVVLGALSIFGSPMGNYIAIGTGSLGALISLVTLAVLLCKGKDKSSDSTKQTNKRTEQIQDPDAQYAEMVRQMNSLEKKKKAMIAKIEKEYDNNIYNQKYMARLHVVEPQERANDPELQELARQEKEWREGIAQKVKEVRTKYNDLIEQVQKKMDQIGV